MRCSHAEAPSAKTLGEGHAPVEGKTTVRADDAAAAAADKRALRDRLLAARAARSAAERSAAGVDIAAGAAALGRPGLAAGFLSVGSEPPTGPLLAALADLGARLIVPVLRTGGELDWATYRPGDQARPGPRGTLHPDGPRLGLDAVCATDLVLVPALAVDRRGQRLGRGGGSYDRTLARLRAARPGEAARSVLVCAVVYDDEVLDEVPTDDHDQPVDAVLTPTRLARMPVDPTS
jgi:5-formyltetrahydrofolate cyclo-ligase